MAGSRFAGMGPPESRRKGVADGRGSEFCHHVGRDPTRCDWVVVLCGTAARAARLVVVVALLGVDSAPRAYND